MKVLDPQAALLTTAEVQYFIKTNPLRKPDKKLGAYEPVNLANLTEIRKDFTRYIDTTLPHINDYPPPDKFMGDVVRRLRQHDLTKTEALTIINLGLGMPRAQPATASTANTDVNDQGHVNDKIDRQSHPGETGDMETTDSAANPLDDSVEPNFRELLRCVIENSEERFAGEEGEQKITEILGVLSECVAGANDRENA